MNNHYSFGSIIVILCTLILFVLALFTKGLTHDILLEAGVFLVSVKLIMATYANSLQNRKIIAKLDDIKALFKKSHKE